MQFELIKYIFSQVDDHFSSDLSIKQIPLPDEGRGLYLLPNGWTRITFNTRTLSMKDYQEDWHFAYHGCSKQTAIKILKSGTFLTRAQCQDVKTALGHVDNQSAVFLSPSIQYSGHPMYAQPWEEAVVDPATGKEKKL